MRAMRTLLVALVAAAALHAPAVQGATITLSPVSECDRIKTNADTGPLSCPSLSTHAGNPTSSTEGLRRRAMLTFDVSGIDPTQVISLTLGLVPVDVRDGTHRFEALGRPDSTSTLDAFVYTNLNPEPGPCASGPCGVVTLMNPADGLGFYSYSEFAELTRVSADVTGAIAAMLGGAPYLQFNLIAVGAPGQGVFFGHSGFTDERLAPATLIVETVPEPGTAALLVLGLIGFGVLRRR